MKYGLNYFKILLLLIPVIFYSCSDDTVSTPPAPPNVQNLVFLDSTYALGGRAAVLFYAEDSLKVGYNKVYFVLYDSVTRNLMTDAHVEILPLNHGHYCPVENPDENAVENKFPGAIILTAPQAADNNSNGYSVLHWHFTVMVHNHQAPGEPEGEAEFEGFTVRDNSDGFKSITMPDSTKLFLSYVSPKDPATGVNDFEFTIHRNEPELFPYESGYSIDMTPEFLADGHTTSGNVNPAHSSIGHYNGRLSLDQNGAWRIKLRLTKNSLWYDTYFDINY
ncbi:MAG: hypothetical protein JSS91_11185 [Bacteroidetes bacterium]|nr:hypothetical protein [Bacteroidota bacterium]